MSSQFFRAECPLQFTGVSHIEKSLIDFLLDNSGLILRSFRAHHNFFPLFIAQQAAIKN